MGESSDWETRLAVIVGLLVAAAAVGYGARRTFSGPAVAPSNAGAAAGFKPTEAKGAAQPSLRRLPKRRVDELRRQRRLELMRQRANQPGPAPLPLRPHRAPNDEAPNHEAPARD